jgi:Transcriptional regulators
MVTIKDVAKASGYSSTMVSYALNGKGNLKEETRQKILQVAKELGYVPNSAAVALRSKKTKMIGLILRNIFNPTFAQLANCIEQTLSEYGYHLTIFSTHGQKRNNDSIIEFCKGGRLDGLIYSVIALDEETLKSLHQYQNSVVLSVSEVSDVQYGSYIATEHLLRLGHKNVAHVASPIDHPNSKHMIKGFERALKVYGKPFDPQLIAYGGHEMGDAEAAAEKLINRLGTPIAIFAASDFAAFGVLNYARKRGLKLEKDIFLVGWDNIPFSESIGLTTVAIRHEAIARSAVHRLLRTIEPDGEFPEVEIPPYELIVRSSCGSLKNHGEDLLE